MVKLSKVYKATSGALVLSCGLFFAVPFCRAETLELVTYYPTSTASGDLRTRSLVVGTTYQGVAALEDGQALISKGLGIGPGFDTTPPQAALHVNGGLFLQGGSGDVNDDGSITSGDATKILDYLNGTDTLTPGEYARSDVNGDGQVTSADYLELQRKLALADPATAFTDAEHATLKQIVDRTIQTDLNRNVSIGEPPAAGGYTAPDGTTTGNLSVHDVFLRATGRWASQGGGFPAPDYDSGWISGSGAGWSTTGNVRYLTLTHRLNTLNTLVFIEGRASGATATHQFRYGVDDTSADKMYGVMWLGKSATQIKLGRGENDRTLDWNEIRVQMWKIGG